MGDKQDNLDTENERRNYFEAILNRRNYIRAILNEFPVSSKNKDKRLLRIQQKIKKFEYKIMKNGIKGSGRGNDIKSGYIQTQEMEEDNKRNKKRDYKNR